jgi:hypothetical protein
VSRLFSTPVLAARAERRQKCRRGTQSATQSACATIFLQATFSRPGFYRLSAGSRLLKGFHDELADSSGHFLEPVGRARGDDDRVTLRQMVRFAALNFRAQILPRFRQLPANHFAAGYEGGSAILHVNHVGFGDRPGRSDSRR